MEIKTKFNIGDRVWIVYENKGEISVYSDIIDTFMIDKEGRVWVFFKYSDAAEMEEKDLIGYDDTQKLLQKIKELDLMIIERDENEE